MPPCLRNSSRRDRSAARKLRDAREIGPASSSLIPEQRCRSSTQEKVMSRYFGWAVLVLVLPLYASRGDVVEGEKKPDSNDTKNKVETVKKAPHKDGEVVALFH